MADRPKNLHPSRSFTRLETAPKSPLSRSRASTLQTTHSADMLDPLKAALLPEEDESLEGDVFAKKVEEEAEDGQQSKAPDTFEDLPIEIRSLTERYSSVPTRF